MNAKQIVGTLAAQLDDDGLIALQTLVKQASTQAVQTAAEQEASQKEAVQKLATDLTNAGFSIEEVGEYLDKLAEQKKEAEDCEAIRRDCEAMGTWIGKTAGDVASQVILQNLSGFVQKHAEDEEEEDKGKEKGEGEGEGSSGGLPPEFLSKEKEDEGSEEGEDEKEKEASARALKLAEILAPVLLQNG